MHRNTDGAPVNIREDNLWMDVKVLLRTQGGGPFGQYILCVYPMREDAGPKISWMDAGFSLKPSQMVWLQAILLASAQGSCRRVKPVAEGVVPYPAFLPHLWERCVIFQRLLANSTRAYLSERLGVWLLMTDGNSIMIEEDGLSLLSIA